MFFLAHPQRSLHASSSLCTDGLSLLVRSTIPQSETQHEIRKNAAHFRKPAVDLFPSLLVEDSSFLLNIAASHFFWDSSVGFSFSLSIPKDIPVAVITPQLHFPGLFSWCVKKVRVHVLLQRGPDEKLCL